MLKDKSEFERFDALVGELLKVPRSEIRKSSMNTGEKASAKSGRRLRPDLDSSVGLQPDRYRPDLSRSNPGRTAPQINQDTTCT